MTELWGEHIWGVGADETPPMVSSAGRYSESVSRIDKYLWWLLPQFLKKAPREESLIGAQINTWGRTLDIARADLRLALLQLSPWSALGDALSRHGRLRAILRLDNEDDGDYWPRVIAATQTHQAAGTLPGLLVELAQVGWIGRIFEPWADAIAYAPPTEPYDRMQILVGDARPITLADGFYLNDGLGLDDVMAATGDFAGHEGELAQYSATDGWLFVPPPRHYRVRIWNTEQTSGDWKRFDGVFWQATAGGGSSHFILYIIGWNGAHSLFTLRHLLRKRRPGDTRAVIASGITSVTVSDLDSDGALLSGGLRMDDLHAST